MTEPSEHSPMGKRGSLAPSPICGGLDNDALLGRESQCSDRQDVTILGMDSIRDT